MPTTFLNISLAIESDEPLDRIQEQVRTDLEYMYEDRNGKVFSITWDRDQALSFLQAQTEHGNPPVQVLTPWQPSPVAQDVAAVLAEFNLTLPKQKKGEPEYRRVRVVGEVQGLPSLRGVVVLTNGIMAYLIVGLPNNGKSKWVPIHWDHFVIDKEYSVPEGLSAPKGRKEREVKTLTSFEGF